MREVFQMSFFHLGDPALRQISDEIKKSGCQ